jgi:hypothetical protein
MLVKMLCKIKQRSPAVCALILFFLCPTFGQEYIFEGDPQLVYEKGNYKQNYNTGLFFFHTDQWKIAIKFFKRCNELTRKKTNQYEPLAWSYIYSGKYNLAKESLARIKNKKHKQVVRLLIKDLKRLPKRKKVSKKDIDVIYKNKIDLIKKTRDNIIAIAKLKVMDYGI